MNVANRTNDLGCPVEAGALVLRWSVCRWTSYVTSQVGDALLACPRSMYEARAQFMFFRASNRWRASRSRTTRPRGFFPGAESPWRKLRSKHSPVEAVAGRTVIWGTASSRLFASRAPAPPRCVPA